MSCVCGREETVTLQGAGDSGVTTPLKPSFPFPILPLGQHVRQQLMETPGGAELKSLPHLHFLFLAPEHRDSRENHRKTGAGGLLLAPQWLSCGVSTYYTLPPAWLRADMLTGLLRTTTWFWFGKILWV